MNNNEKTQRKQEFINEMRTQENYGECTFCAACDYCTAKRAYGKMLEQKIFFWQVCSCTLEHLQYFAWLHDEHQKRRGIYEQIISYRNAAGSFARVFCEQWETARKIEPDFMSTEDYKQLEDRARKTLLELHVMDICRIAYNLNI